VELSVSPEQVKAARELLGWIQGDLAFEARLSQTSVSRFERGARHCGRQVIDAMQRALEAAGIEFISGDQPAVKIRDAP
jgi:transcriptional regulator with XRE-family HTH domain